MWNRKFRSRPPSKPESWRCENEAFARDLPQEWEDENEVFVREFPQKVKAEDVKTKLSCEASLKKWKKWKCENKAFVEISFILDMTIGAVKTKLSCETALKNCMLKMWNRRCEHDFRARHSSKTEDENEAFVPDLLQLVKKVKLYRNESWTVRSTAGPIRSWSRCSRNRFETIAQQTFPIHPPRHVLSCKTPHYFYFVHLRISKITFRARHPSKSQSWRCENEAFVRDRLKKGKMWKQSFRARPPKTAGWRCENEAFVRDFPQKLNLGFRWSLGNGRLLV